MKYFVILILILISISCKNNSRKQAIHGPVSINEVWQFKTIDTTICHSKTPSSWIGANILDLSHTDTLKFSYGSIHNKPTAYPYKIRNDTIFIQNKPAYKIIKLTYDELDLLVAFNKIKKDSTVIIYRVK